MVNCTWLGPVSSQFCSRILVTVQKWSLEIHVGVRCLHRAGRQEVGPEGGKPGTWQGHQSHQGRSGGLWTAQKKRRCSSKASVTQGAVGLVLHRRKEPSGPLWWLRSVVPTHGQVHKGEHIELRHDGEAEEHTIQEEAPTAQLLVQLPLV